MYTKKRVFRVIFLLITVLFIWQCGQQKKISIYMIGDSTMAQYDSTRYPLTGWGMKLHLFFNDNVTIVNKAVSGSSTRRFIVKKKWDKVKEALQPGDYLIIQFGHNDEKPDTLRHTEPYGTFSQNLKKFITESRAKGATPILVTPVRRRRFDENGVLVDTHGEYPNAVRAVAKELNVPLIDLQKQTKALYEKYGVEGSKKLFLWVEPEKYAAYPDGNIDNTHYSDLGAFEICKLVAEDIKKSDLGLKEYLVNPDYNSAGKDNK